MTGEADPSGGMDPDVVRAAILDLASEDCYELIDAVGNLDSFYPSLSRADKIRAVRHELQILLNQGIVRLHRGALCSAGALIGDELTVLPDEFDSILGDDAASWNPEAERNVYLCDTEKTESAYRQVWSTVAGKRSRR